MNHRSGRSLLIALLAALQLVLQPLAATAWCAMLPAGSDGCCCGHVDDSAAGPTSASDDSGCCGSLALEDGEDEQDAPCGCYSAPSLPPSTPPGAPESLRAAPAAVLPPVAELTALPKLRRRAAIVRARAPGGGPPLHLLLQVFRL